MPTEPQKPLTSPTVPLTDLIEFAKELKKPYIDPSLVAKRERDSQRMRQQVAENRRVKAAKEASCSHRREDNTSAIAWMTNSDMATRGVCQRCNRLVQPDDADYMILIAVPDRAIGMVI